MKVKSIYELEMLFESIGKLAIADEETNTVKFEGKLLTPKQAIVVYEKHKDRINKKDRRRRDYRKRVELNE